MAQGRPLTKEQYDRAIDFFRGQPGAIAACARFMGIDPATAGRLWRGPTSKTTPWQIPAREVFAGEKVAQEKRADEERQREQRELIRAQEQAAALKAELTKVDEAILRVGRSNVLGALGGLSRVTRGIDMLAKRIGDQLEKGVDATGKAIPDLTLTELMKVMTQFSQSTRSLTEAARIVVEIDRLRHNLPTTIVGIDVAAVTVGDAAREVELASENLKRARALGFVVDRAADSAPDQKH